MRVRDLPGIPRLFVDLIEDAPPLNQFLFRLSSVDSLRAWAMKVCEREVPREELCGILAAQAAEFCSGEQALAGITRLQRPDAVVILTSYPIHFAGGPLFLLLKCLAAAKLADELQRSGIPAVPVCWIDSEPAFPSDSPSISLLDPKAGLRNLALDLSQGAGYRLIGDCRVPPQVKSLLEAMEDTFGDDQQREFIQTLRELYAPGTVFSLATGRLIAALFKDWGIVMLDPRRPAFCDLASRFIRFDEIAAQRSAMLLKKQRERLLNAGYIVAGQYEAVLEGDPHGLLGPLLLDGVFPIAAHVVDHIEVYRLALIAPLLSGIRLGLPPLWPRPSATIVDTRSRKMLERYDIAVGELFSGKEKVIEKHAYDKSEKVTINRLQILEELIESALQGLAASLAAGDALAKQVEESRGKMAYQVGKLKERFDAAGKLHRAAMNRHIERLHDSLAPYGRAQETALAGLHFILRYSPVVLRILYEKLDIRTFEHQILYVE